MKTTTTTLKSKKERDYREKQRIVTLWGAVEDESSSKVIDRLLFLDHLSGEEITLVINSPGGLNTAGMAILDVMDHIRSPLATVTLGLAASFGALILACGDPDRRYAAPRSRIMIHQPHVMGHAEAPARDLSIMAKSIVHDRDVIESILAKRTGKELKEIQEDIDRDLWLTAEEAKSYGLVDRVGIPEALTYSNRAEEIKQMEG